VLYQSPRLATLPPLEGSENAGRPRSASLDSVADAEPIADFDAAAQPKKKLARADLVLKQTPPLPPPDSPQFGAALSAKLAVCTAECFWEDPDADVAAKKVKAAALNEVLELVRPGCRLAPPQLEQIIDVIDRAILKTQPALVRSDNMIEISEPAWPHYAIHFRIMNAIVAAFRSPALHHHAVPAVARRQVSLPRPRRAIRGRSSAHRDPESAPRAPAENSQNGDRRDSRVPGRRKEPVRRRARAHEHRADVY
jgi:hypothetical protein